MQRLPPLVAGSGKWLLPASDYSTATLAELLVGGPTDKTVASLVERLAADPPLVLWSVCEVDRRAHRPLQRLCG